MLGGIVADGTRTLGKAVGNATLDRTRSVVTGTGQIVRQTGGAAVDLGVDFVEVGSGAITDFGRGVSRGVRGASDAVAEATLSLLESLGLAQRRTPPGPDRDSVEDPDPDS